MYVVRTQPGGRGGQAIVINFITVQGGGGSKKAENLRTYYVYSPKGEKSTASYNVSCQPNILWCDISDERNCKGQGLLAFCNLVPKYFFYNSFEIPDNFSSYWQ